jgi:hypothetical protein
MAIFNSYVKLPEGILYSYFWFWNLANKNRHFDWHKMEKTWFGKQPFLQGRKTKLMEKKCTHTHTRFTSLLGLSQCWRVQYSILMQSWHTKPFVGPLPPWLWAILPIMILPAGFIKGFQPRRKCWKHQETSGKHRCVHMFWPSMFPDFRRKVILHDWLVMSHFSVYETIPARWKGKGDSSNEQLNELKDPEYVPWRFLARLWWSDIQNGV